MSTRYLEAAALNSFPGSVDDTGDNARPIYVASNSEAVLVYDKTNSRWVPVSQPVAKVVIASATLAFVDAAKRILVDAVAGLTLTLPVAVGSGMTFRIGFKTSLTSAAVIIACAGSDKFYGGVLINDTGGSAAATADYFPAVGGTSVTLTLTQSLGAGVIGDWIEVTDVGALKWAVSGVLNAEPDPTTPWS